MECEVYVNGIRLEHASEFKYMRCVFDESGTDGPECSRKVASGRRVAGAWLMLWICSFSVLVFHETLLVPAFVHVSETMLWKDKAVQMDNLRELLGIWRMD